MKLLDLFEKAIPTISPEEVRENCKQFLKQINYDPSLIVYRGTKSDAATGWIRLKTTRLQDRHSRDTDQRTHVIANEYFQKKFKHPYRNALFATSDSSESTRYGEEHVMFPKGKFSFIWSEKVDDFTEVVDGKIQRDKIYNKTDGNNSSVKEISTIIDSLKYIDTDLPRAIESRNEIMFWCKEYYLIDKDMFDRSYKDVIFKK